MTICVLPGEHVGLCGRFPVVVITWCAEWRDVILIMTSLSYGHNSVFCGLTWGRISGVKIGRYRLLLSQNAVYTRFIPSPRPQFWDVVSRQLIEQGSSHRGCRWLVFQVLKVIIVRWDGFVRKVGLVSALFSEIDAFRLEGLESVNPPTFFVFASVGCMFCSPINQAQNFGMECGLLVIVIFVEMSSDRVGSFQFDVI